MASNEYDYKTSGYFCQACKSEISFEQKVIRDNDKWYHSSCVKQETKSKEFEKLDDQLFEKPVKESIEKIEEIPNENIKKEGILCAFCRDIITDNEESVKSKKKKYHVVCFKIYGKNPINLSGEAHKKETNNRPSSIDPVLIIITSGIFVLLFYTAYRMLSGLSLLAITIGIGLAFYHIIDSSRTNRKKKKRNLPSYFIFITLIMPIVFGAIVAYDGFSVWYSVPKAIIVWGLTLTFWSNMVFVPLSVYSKSKDVGTYGNTYNPFVSIIVPAYNEEKVIRATIESILATDYQRREIIVIDDGSKDRTFEIASEYKDRVKALHKENGGKPSALNYGLLYAKGQIIISVDADTILAPQAISALVEGFRRDEVGALAGNIKVRNRTNWITKCQALEYVAGIQIFRRTLDFFDAVPIVPGALGAFRKDRLQKIGNFSKDTLAEDFDATLKILKSGNEVGGIIDSKAYTESPNSIRQFYRQRKRWYRGDMQVLVKHKDSMMNPRFGTLYKLTYPLMIMSMFVTPFSGLVVWVFVCPRDDANIHHITASSKCTCNTN
ncbi:MAG: glycosyltransferase [Candidatus Nitrosotenuis sp.]|nr:glycosyltransferase [Candidatus Nitrosotenuis sp.]